MSSVTGLVRLPGRMLCLFTGEMEISALSQETKPKWWNIKLDRLRLLYGFIDCFTFTTTSAVETHTRHYVQKCFTRAGVFILKRFHSQYRDFGRKVRDLGNRGSPASHLKKSNFVFLKKRAARRVLGNGANQVDLADMKRPSSSNSCKSESGKSREDAIKARLE